MKVMTKDEVVKKISEIGMMDRYEASKYKESVLMSNIDSKARGFLVKACDEVISNSCPGEDFCGATVVHAEAEID